MSGLKNTETGNDFASEIEGVLENYTDSSLGTVDEESTITANANSMNSFNESQSTLKSFKSTLEIDAENIAILAEEFDKYDKLMCENNKKLGEAGQ